MPASSLHRRSLAVFAFSLVMSTGVAACTDEGAASEARAVARVPAFQELGTPIEIVTALRDIFTNDVLLRAGLYTEKNLRRVFGEHAAMTRSKELSFGSEFITLEASISGHGRIRVHAIVIGRRVHSASIAFDLSSATGVSYQRAAELFQFERNAGNRLPDEISIPSPHGGPRPPATNIHGNKAEGFTFVVGSYTKSLGCQFGPDGTLAELSISVRDRR